MGLMAIEAVALPKRLTYFELRRWGSSKISNLGISEVDQGKRFSSSRNRKLEQLSSPKVMIAEGAEPSEAEV